MIIVCDGVSNFPGRCRYRPEKAVRCLVAVSIPWCFCPALRPIRKFLLIWPTDPCWGPSNAAILPELHRIWPAHLSPSVFSPTIAASPNLSRNRFLHGDLCCQLLPYARPAANRWVAWSSATSKVRVRRRGVVGRVGNWWTHGDRGSSIVVGWVPRRCLPACCSDPTSSSGFTLRPIDDGLPLTVLRALRCVLVRGLVAIPFEPIVHPCVRVVLSGRVRRCWLRGLVLPLWACWAVWCVRLRIGWVCVRVRLWCASGSHFTRSTPTFPITSHAITLVLCVIAIFIHGGLIFLQSRHQEQERWLIFCQEGLIL